MNDLSNFPIFVMPSDSRDRLIRFRDLHSLRAEVEAIDVENGEFWAWNRYGVPIALKVSSDGIGTGELLPADAQPILNDLLRRAAADVGLPSNLDSGDHSAKYEAIEQRYSADQPPRRWLDRGPLWIPTRCE